MGCAASKEVDPKRLEELKKADEKYVKCFVGEDIKVFSRLEAKWKGSRQWYDAEINKVYDDGTYEVHYSGTGAIQLKVPRETDIRRYSPPDVKLYEEGDQVSVLVDTFTWYTGKVVKCKNDLSIFEVELLAGTRNVSVFAERIRPKKKQFPTAAENAVRFFVDDRVKVKPNDGGADKEGTVYSSNFDATYDVLVDGEDSVTVRLPYANLKHVEKKPEVTQYAVGDQVDVANTSAGKFYQRGYITAVTGPAYDVRLLNGAVEANKTAKDLRPRVDEYGRPQHHIELAINQRARYFNCAKSGIITAINPDGFCTIRNDGGEVVENCAPELVFIKPLPTDEPLEVDQEVKMKLGKPKSAKIVAMHDDGTYNIEVVSDKDVTTLQENVCTDMFKPKTSNLCVDKTAVYEEGQCLMFRYLYWSVGTVTSIEERDGEKVYFYTIKSPPIKPKEGLTAKDIRPLPLDATGTEFAMHQRVVHIPTGERFSVVETDTDGHTYKLRNAMPGIMYGNQEQHFVKPEEIRAIDFSGVEPFEVGQSVSAEWVVGLDSSRKWCPAKITAAHEDGTYDVAYDNGSTDQWLGYDQIRAQQ